MLEYAGLAVAVLIPTGAIIWGYGALGQRLTSHEELDRVRFSALENLVKEVRTDVKVLLTNGNHCDHCDEN